MALKVSTLDDDEVVHQRTAQRTLRQHALDGVAQHLVDTVGALAELLGRVETLTTGIASITGIDLIRLLLA